MGASSQSPAPAGPGGPRLPSEAGAGDDAGTPLRIDAPAAAAGARIGAVDMARGVGIVAMVVYHFAWDLSFFRYIAVDVGAHPLWVLFARSIAASFLLLVGVSLVLATRRGLRPRPFLRRLAVVAAAAAAVTIATRLAFPQSFVFFGILHAIAVSSVLALPFLKLPVAAVAAAAVFFFAGPSLLAGPAFDAPALWWLGLTSFTPMSNDYVPIFPWFGFVLAGLAAARLALRLAPARGPRPARRPAAPLAALAWAGRRSLVIYLLHQPILFGALYAVQALVGPPPGAFAAAVAAECTASCGRSGAEAGLCRTACACVADAAVAAGLDRANPGEGAGLEAYRRLAERCWSPPAE